MLVVSRRYGERVKIFTDPPVWITIVDIERGKVRLGIDVDRAIGILREELIEPIAGPSAEAFSAADGSGTVASDLGEQPDAAGKPGQ